MIPKLLHFIWVGDESKVPAEHINSWIKQHPDFSYVIWDNAAFSQNNWQNKHHMDLMWGQELCGVADMMRWEILFRHGGILVDADSFCLQRLPDWLFTCESFCCWENELFRPGLLATGYVGTVPRTMFMKMLVDDITIKDTVIDREAWKSVGPTHFTEVWRKLHYHNLTILPSHFFIPRHYSGFEYTAKGPVYAKQEWGSTLHKYGELK